MSFKLWNFGVLGGEAQGNASIRKFSYLIPTTDLDTFENVASDNYFISEKARLLLNDIIEVYDAKDQNNTYHYLVVTEVSLSTVKTKEISFQDSSINWGELKGNIEDQTDLIEYLENLKSKWGNITGTLSDQTDLQTELNKKVNIQQGSDNVGKILEVNANGNLELKEKDKYEDDFNIINCVLQGSSVSQTLNKNDLTFTIASGFKWRIPNGKYSNNNNLYIEKTLDSSVTKNFTITKAAIYYIALNQANEIRLIEQKDFKINNYDFSEYSYITSKNLIAYNKRYNVVTPFGLIGVLKVIPYITIEAGGIIIHVQDSEAYIDLFPNLDSDIYESPDGKSGYIIDRNTKTCIQWGRMETLSATGTITLLKPYKNNCYNITTSLLNSSEGFTILQSRITPTNFTFTKISSDVQFMWKTIGFIDN